MPEKRLDPSRFSVGSMSHEKVKKKRDFVIFHINWGWILLLRFFAFPIVIKVFGGIYHVKTAIF